jgi:hypothetical protein
VEGNLGGAAVRGAAVGVLVILGGGVIGVMNRTRGRGHRQEQGGWYYHEGYQRDESWSAMFKLKSWLARQSRDLFYISV